MSDYGSTHGHQRPASRTSSTSDNLMVGSVGSHGVPGKTYKRSTSRTTPAPTLARRVSHISVSTHGETEADGPADDALGLTTMPRDKIFIVVTFCIVNFGLGIFYSLLGPFFPNEAAKKGSSTAVTGLIFGVFELVLFIMSPVFGNFITHLGAKFLYCTGILVCGFSSILFGFLDRSPDGTVYVVMCFIVRTMEGLGAAAFATASFSIMAHTFPKNVATMFGALELFTGIGLMVGPPVGGALFQVGGFLLPFALSGGLMMVVGFVSIFLLPSVQDLRPSKGGFVLALLRIPLVSIMGFYLAMGAVAISFLDVGLSLWLQKIYNFSPVITGLVFLATPGVYAITAPFWGYVSDSHPRIAKPILIVGYILGGVAFIMLGPAPFIPLPQDNLALLISMLGLGGLGIGTLVITFLVMTEATREAGYPDSLDTYGLISGIFNSFFSLGAFAGPLMGGYLIDQFDFPTASVFVGGLMIFMVVVLGVYMIVERCCIHSVPNVDESSPQNDERAHLLESESVET